MARLKMLYFVRGSRVKLSSTLQKIFVKLKTSFALQLPPCFKNKMILSEPSDIEEAPIITGTLEIHKFRQCPLTRRNPINAGT